MQERLQPRTILQIAMNSRLKPLLQTASGFYLFIAVSPGLQMKLIVMTLFDGAGTAHIISASLRE